MHKHIKFSYLLGASFLGVRGISCGSTSNSKSWTLVCMFFDFGLPGPGPGPWLPFPSSFCFLGLEWREEAERSASFPNFRNLLSPFLSCQSVSICFREQKYKSWHKCVGDTERTKDQKRRFSPVSVLPVLGGAGWQRRGAFQAQAEVCPALQCQYRHPQSGWALQCSVDTLSSGPQVWSHSTSEGDSP